MLPLSKYLNFLVYFLIWIRFENNKSKILCAKWQDIFAYIQNLMYTLQEKSAALCADYICD